MRALAFIAVSLLMFLLAVGAAHAAPDSQVIYRNGVHLKRGEFAVFRVAVKSLGKPVHVKVKDRRSKRSRTLTVTRDKPAVRNRFPRLRVRVALHTDAKRVHIRVKNRRKPRRARVVVRQ